MTSKTTRVCLSLLVLLLLGAIVSHGVIVPRFIWQPRLNAILAEHPDIHVQADRVVLAIKLHPKLIVAGLSVKADRFDESTHVDLFSASVNGWKSLTRWQWVPEQVTLKHLTLQTDRKADCTQKPRDCIPRTPFAAYGLMSQWLHTLPALQMQQASFELNKPGNADSIQAFVDDFNLNLQQASASKPAELNAALRLLGSSESGRALYLTMKAYPRLDTNASDKGIELDQLALQANGRWANYPWSGNLSAQRVAFEGYPVVKVKINDLKSYLRRDDAPDSHQAALAIHQAEGGLPNQAWNVQQAEWTYTADQASAWAFNLQYQPDNSQISISPAAPQTADAHPAEAQTRSLNCDAPLRKDKPIWAWTGQWFEVANSLKDVAGNPLVLCPIQAQAAGASPGL